LGVTHVCVSFHFRCSENVLLDSVFGELEYIDGYQFYARDSPLNILFVREYTRDTHRERELLLS